MHKEPGSPARQCLLASCPELFAQPPRCRPHRPHPCLPPCPALPSPLSYILRELPQVLRTLPGLDLDNVRRGEGGRGLEGGRSVGHVPDLDTYKGTWDVKGCQAGQGLTELQQGAVLRLKRCALPRAPRTAGVHLWSQVRQPPVQRQSWLACGTVGKAAARGLGGCSCAALSGMLAALLPIRWPLSRPPCAAAWAATAR